MPRIPSRWHPEKDADDAKDKPDERPSDPEDVIGKKRRILYFHNDRVADFHYGRHHPMKPHRLGVTHNLVVNYNLHNYMTCIEHPPANFLEMTSFHDPAYISSLNTDKKEGFLGEEYACGVTEDVPIFDGLYDFVKLYTGGTIQAAKSLNCGLCDIAINWSGGLHHAKKAQASGFCYVNDIVIGILQLLKVHQRVLYIDIDIHHGDGVEEAFYWTDRVMTVSFHHFSETFFPGTGILEDIGGGPGRFYTMNYPLKEGIDDDNYARLFKPVIKAIVTKYDPNVIVLQCGADSLCSDKLGKFNLSFNGHGECVRYVKSLNRPLMVLGGGGYRLRNVARCWANETAIIVEQDDVIDPIIPEGVQYREAFAPEHYKLRPDLPQRFNNLNTAEYLDLLRVDTAETMRDLAYAPSVQIQPEDLYEPGLLEFLREPSIMKTYRKVFRRNVRRDRGY